MEITKQLIERLENMKDGSGRPGCTYGDTNYDSCSACFGYNLAIENIIDVLTKEMNNLTHKTKEERL